MNWKEYFKQNSELTIATSSKNGIPNANIVMSHGFVGDKLLIADCQMATTINNLIENPKICIVGGGYHRLRGRAEVFSSGENVEIIKKQDHNITDSGEYQVRHAVLVTVDEVYNLDKLETIYQPK